MNTYIKFTDDNSDSLTHYGVKGMKWRHHKYATSIKPEDNDFYDTTDIHTRFSQYGISRNDPDRIDTLARKERLYKRGMITRREGMLKARPSLAPALKYNSERAKKTIDRLFSKAKKGLTKTINKKRSIDIGRHHLEYGMMNSRDASGRKNTRYIQYRRGGKPKYFRAF